MKKLFFLILLLSIVLPNNGKGIIFTHFYSNNITQNKLQITDTTALIMDLRREQLTLQSTLQELETENQQLKTNIQLLDVKNLSLVAQFEEYQKKLNDLLEQNSILSTKADESGNTLEEVENDLMSKGLLISQLNNEKAQLQTENGLLNTRISELEAKNLILMDEVGKANFQMNKLDEQNTLLETHLKEINEEIFQHQENKNRLNTEISSLQNNIQELMQKLELTAKEFENNKGNNQVLTEQMQQMQLSVAASSKESEEYQKQLSKLNSELATLKLDYKNSLAEVDLLKKEKTESENLNESIEKKNKDIELEKIELNRRINEMMDEIRLLKVELQKYEKTISEYKTSNN